MPIVSANGAEIPALGLGTWPLKGKEGIAAVSAALDAGYRHIDTAAMYHNEREVGEAIAGHSVPRDEIFLTTKVWHTDLARDALLASVEASLEQLRVDQVDLLLIHWPSRQIPLAEQVGNLCEAKRRGFARHIGVSNFPSRMVDAAVAATDEPLVTNQVEYHPFLDQNAVLAACRRHGLALTAYSPIAKGRVADSPIIQAIARDRGRSETQIALRWLIQQPGVIAIPKSADPARIRANMAIADFVLTDAEMARISALGSRDGRTVNFEWSPDWD
ncbi:MAG TPA: aldo/keto reductase [Afifellaceae bacterium]|nr:aldo/keto reductase [Afifellaceae bacterium]